MNPALYLIGYFTRGKVQFDILCRNLTVETKNKVMVVLNATMCSLVHRHLSRNLLTSLN
jgi:hypothetical protein